MSTSMTMSSTAEPGFHSNAPNSGGDANEKGPWEQAWDTLSDEDKKQYGSPSMSMLETLNSVQKATESRQKYCVDKGWTLYRNKNGEKVILRHVLEKIHKWVETIIKIVDVGVSADHSGHAVLPWAIVKLITEVGFSSIDVFSKVVEGIETVSALISRYTIVEKLYLHQDCESRSGLEQAITKLYAATLTYLAKVNKYCAKNTLGRFGQELKEAIAKEYKELYSKISEADVDRWRQLADAELQRAIREGAFAHDQVAKDTSQKLLDTLNGLDKPIMQMSDNVSMIKETLEKKERRKVFDWMSKIGYKKHHKDLSAGLLAGSGQWLLKSQQFIEWGQSSVSSILWLHGIPGSGKTALASTVINAVTDVNPNPSTSPSAFFYCARSTAEPERSRPAEIMGSLLRQLASMQSDLFVKDPVVQEYKARKEEAEKDNSALQKLTVQDCIKLIVELTKHQPATIILDALDECEEDTRHELLEAFDEIISQSTEVVKVFVSSRDDTDIKLHLEKSKNISIGVENNSSDIARFVQSEVDRLISDRLLLDGIVSAELKGKIIEKLTKGAQGMFRWVEMSLEALKQTKCKKDFKAALGKLPNELSGLYDIIHAQICQTGPYGRDIAVQTLKWLLCAQRLLSVEELLAAVYKVDEDTYSDSDEEVENGNERLQSSENEVLRLCRNLVVFDSKKIFVRFAHQSVREYLLKLPQYTPVQQHILATERCIDVYLIERMESSIARKRERQNDILRRYAQVYWPVHYKHVEDSNTTEFEKQELRYTGRTEGRSLPYVQRIFDILKPYPKVHRSVHYEYAEDFEASPLGKKMSRFIGSVHGKSPPYMDWILDICFYCQSLDDWRALNSSLGLDPWDDLGRRVKFIVHQFSEVHQEDMIFAVASAFGISSLLQGRELPKTGLGDLLCFALEQGHCQVGHLLIDRGVDVNSQDQYGSIALVEASDRGYNQIVQMLLDRGADINAQNRFVGSALSVASFNGHEQIVQMLLDRGADTDAEDIRGETALQLACTYGHKQIVQMLLDRGADPRAQDHDGHTALHEASDRGHEKTVQILLNRGADVNAQDKNSHTALHLASQRGYTQIVQMLLDHGASINARGRWDDTALQAASSGDHAKVVQMLLDWGANVHAQDEDGSTALHLAFQRGFTQIVQILLDREADVHAQDKSGLTALYWASEMGHDQVVRILFARGAKVKIQDESQVDPQIVHDRAVERNEDFALSEQVS